MDEDKHDEKSMTSIKPLPTYMVFWKSKKVEAAQSDKCDLDSKTDTWKATKTKYNATNSCLLNIQSTLIRSKMNWVNLDSPRILHIILINKPAEQCMSAADLGYSYSVFIFEYRWIQVLKYLHSSSNTSKKTKNIGICIRTLAQYI